MLFNHQLKEFEVGIIANLMPETAEEAKCLVPSLKVRRQRARGKFAQNEAESIRHLSGRFFSVCESKHL